MISVCIPVYNCNLEGLIQELNQQFISYNNDYEIVVIDDASDLEYKKANLFLRKQKHVKYIELETNIGRSAIRNLFAEHTKFDNLLFLDCDSKLINSKFINTYHSNNYKDYKVICGGRIYDSRPVRLKYILRWKYGIYRECKMAGERSINPWQSFMTNNFMIDKTTLQNIRFETRLKGYGHEDSLFGYQLKLRQIQIKHIDNQTLHIFSETSKDFLLKTKEGIRNLHYIHTVLLPDGEFITMNKLLRSFTRISNLGLVMPFRLFSYLILPLAGLFFRIGMVPLWLFDFYKLLYLCRISLKKITSKFD